MERSDDFSAPRRMSKSAYAIFFVKELRRYISLFLILVLLYVFDPEKHRSFMETMEALLYVSVGYLLLATVVAFISYYYKKYYIKNGNLIFIYGLFKNETTIPLHKVQSLRTRRGFMYRLFDMKGVSFDTLASKTAEVELILDYKDWNMLLEKIEQQEQVPEEDKQSVEENVMTKESKSVNDKCILKLSNLNLIKGAFCQNHFKGMVVLLGILFTFYDKILSASDRILNLFIDYVSEHADYTSLSVTVFVMLLLILYVIVMVLWIVKVFMRYYNMEIHMDKAQLFFESGLFTRFSSRFSYDKVCTVYVNLNSATLL